MDGTENPQGTPQPQAGQPSAGVAQGTSTPRAKTYSESDYQKAISDERATAGRKMSDAAREIESLKASITDLRDKYKSAAETLAEQARRAEEAELEEIQGNPEALNLYQLRKKLRQEQSQLEARQAELDKREANHAEELAVSRESQWEIALWDVAQKYGADLMTLKELNLSDIAVVEHIAKTIGTKKDGKVAPASGRKPDSGLTIGGGVDVDGLSPLEKIKVGLQDRAKRR